MAKDIMFSYAGTLIISLSSFAFVVAAIRVRIVNLVSVIGYCIECFYSAHKREYKKQVGKEGKSWNLEHNAHDQEEKKQQNKISNLLFDEIFF